jgi:hypothetical protein
MRLNKHSRDAKTPCAAQLAVPVRWGPPVTSIAICRVVFGRQCICLLKELLLLSLMPRHKPTVCSPCDTRSKAGRNLLRAGDGTDWRFSRPTPSSRPQRHDDGDIIFGILVQASSRHTLGRILRHLYQQLAPIHLRPMLATRKKGSISRLLRATGNNPERRHVPTPR